MRELSRQPKPPVLPPGSPDLQERLTQEQARDDLQRRLAAEYDLELLAIAKGRVRDQFRESTWRAYEGTAELGRTVLEVAAELGLSVGAVHQHRYAVITRLRQEIAALDPSL
jgi:hypothetical protein